MANRPVRFVCSACGLDASEFVNDLIRRELTQNAPAQPAPPAAPAPAAAAAPVGELLDVPPPAAVPAPAPRIRLSAPAAPETQPPNPTAAANPLCAKHPGQLATHRCYVCSKPICPKCMEVLGYVCSPLCKAKAQSHGLKIPVYEFQTSVIDARQWRKVVRVGTAVGSALALLFVLYVWWIALGQRPHTAFSVRFPEPSYSGQSFICGPKNNQIVFLHGGTLARYDMARNQAIWSRDLIDHNQVAADAAREMREMEESKSRMYQDNPEISRNMGRTPSLPKLTQMMEREAAAELALHVRSGSVWVARPDKLVRYDWDTGEPLKEIPYKPGYADLVARGDELLLMDTSSGHAAVTHINLNNSDCRTEDFGAPAPQTAGTAPPAGTNVSAGSAPHLGRDSELAGLPTVPGKEAGQPMDPAKVAEQVRHLPLPGRIALPAVLAVTMNQERAIAELSDDPKRPAQSSTKRDPDERISIIPTGESYVQVGVKLIEARTVEKTAMKPAAAKSVLESGNLSVANSGEAANEILNQMQRDRGGDKILEDESRYQVTLRSADGTEGWSGVVTGTPTLFPLQTVNVLAADKRILVFDKANKKLWESPLSYNVSQDLSSLDPDNAPYGQGPCAEHKGSLYIFDQGVLTVFDLASGGVRWRLTSVGIAGLFFDDRNNLYVNTSTAGLDSIRYSRQIDVSRMDRTVVLKIDCRNGKILWRAEPGAMVNYVSGKFIYAATYYEAPNPDEDMGPFASAGISSKSFMRLRRLNPGSGTEMWLHTEERAPLDIQFDKNSIRMVFKKEVEVLRSRAF
jgi:hypothetical protein